MKLQAMELFKDTHLVNLELLSNATIIDSALQYFRSNKNNTKGWFWIQWIMTTTAMIISKITNQLNNIRSTNSILNLAVLALNYILIIFDLEYMKITRERLFLIALIATTILAVIVA